MDDRKDFRLVRYRCSLNPEAQGSGLRAQADSMQEQALAGLLPDVGPGGLSLEDWSKIDPFVYDGLLGVYRLGGDVAENTLESHDHDKSDSMAKSILEVIRRACLDPDGDLDQESFAMIQSKVQHFASDQGPSAMKCGKIMPSIMPTILWVSHDAAHQVRNAFKDPLHAVQEFSEQWERLFGGRHALIPDIQNSEVWKSRLMAAQRAVLDTYGKQGAGMTRTVRALSFAAQRFDSTATPLLKYCCMVRAIALVCAMQAADVTCLQSRLSFVGHCFCFNSDNTIYF